MEKFPPLADMELGFRLSYDELAEIMEVLTYKFTFGGNKKDHPQVAEMRRRCGTAAWKNVLALAGWTENEFENITLARLDTKNRVVPSERWLSP